MMRFVRDWLRFIWAVLRITPAAALLYVLVTVILGVQPAVEFWALQGLTNYVVGHLGPAFAWRVAGGWVAWLAGASLLGELGRALIPYLNEWLRQDAERGMEGRLLDRAGRTPLLTLESSDFFNRFTRARDGLRRNIFDVIELTQGIATAIMSVVSVLGVMATTHWGALAALVVGAIPVWLMRQRVASAWVELWRNVTEEQRQNQYLADLMTQRKAAQEIRLFGLGPEFFSRWDTREVKLVNQRLAIFNRIGAVSVVSGLIGAVSFTGAIVVLSVAALTGGLSIGTFVAGAKVSQDMQNSLQQLAWLFGNLRRTAGFTGDYWEFVDSLPPEEAGAEAGAAAMAVVPAPSAIEVSNLSFRYPGASKDSLHGISFRVAPGELIALVGENGAGKSTLVKLLMGLYPPTAGTIRVDGVDPATPEGAEVRARIAPVFQDYARYSVAAGENIGVGDAAAVAEQARIETAATGSGAAEVIDGLPQGYATILGKQWAGGEELSGGQWQKVAIARGYMRRASLLVLDEPTAALDPQAELEVFRRFQGLVQGRTGFLISHRLGAARLADRVFVLKGGSLVELGSHDELMARGGEYATLFEAQAGWYK